MQYNKNKFLGILVMVLALTAVVATAQAATWDSTTVFHATSVTKYDVAVGNHLKGASDDTVRILTTQSASPYYVLLSTDRSTAPPMNWVTETVYTNTVAMRGCAIGDVDNDGQNEIIVGHTASPYGLKMIKWSGSAWVATTVLTTTNSYVGAIYDIAIGDADNNSGTPNDIVFNNSSYGVMKARWNGATFDTTRLLYNTSLGSVYGVAMGDFDQTYAGNEIVAVTYNQYVYRIRWTGAAWDATQIYYIATDLDFYDVAVGNFDASNPGDEIAINNGYNYTTYGAVLELYGSGATWTQRPIYTASTWGSSGEIAVGDFYSGNAGAEVVAVSGGGSEYDARLIYGSGTTWNNEKIMGTVSSTYGVAVGNVNRYHTGNEMAVGGNYKVWEAEEFIPLANDMATMSIDNPPAGSTFFAGDTAGIRATVKNLGTTTQNQVPVNLLITDGASYTYTDVETTGSLVQNATQQIIFAPNWTVPNATANYTITVTTALALDQNLANDAKSASVSGFRTGYTAQDFGGTTFPPEDWTVYNFDGGDPWVRYTTYYHSAPASAEIYYDLPNNDWLITPRVSVQSGDLLSFWWRTQSTSYNETLFVRVSTSSNVSDTGSYSIIANVGSTGNISWFNKLVNLSSYAGQNVYIAFWYRCNNNLGMLIDDVILPPRWYPTNDVGVTKVFEPPAKGHVYKTATPDSIGMEIKNYGTAAQSNFYVHYDLAFDEGRDSVLHTASLAFGIRDTIYAHWTPEHIGIDTIYGWTALSGDEAPGNDKSKLTVTINTAGLVLYEDFSGTTFPPAGWTVYNFGTTPGDAWVSYTAYYHSSPACAQIYYDAPNNDWLITPNLSVKSGNWLNFWWRTHSTSYTETLYVRLSTSSNVSDTGSYSIIALLSSTGNTSWFNKEIDLSSYAGQNIYVAFWYRCNNFYGMAIDDITVYTPGPRIAISPPDSLVIPMVTDQILDTTLFISNTGGGTLTYSISEIPAAAWLTETPSSGDVPGALTDTINLHLNATGYGLGGYRTVLEVASNSETKGIKAHDYLPVIMKIGGPHVSAAPESLHVGLCPPATKDTSVILTSNGTEDLIISGVKVVQTQPKEIKFYMGTLPKEEPIQGKEDKPEISTSKRHMTFKSGGPDIYGHYWIDSDDPGGPAFNWIDISGTGTQILGLGDDTNLGPFPLNFTFNYYGNNYNQIQACSNGWFSFTSTATSYTNFVLPSASAPDNMLAIFWDDMNFTTSGTAYYQTIGDKFIIEYKNAARYSTGELFTYEMILDKTCGTITYQYLSMQPGNLNSATIGIQNALKNDGLTIAYNEYYVHDSLAIRIQTNPLWVSIDPCVLVDTLAINEKDTLGVTFTTPPPSKANYRGEIRLTTNAPGQFTKVIPVAMDILAPTITVTPSSITDTCLEGGTAQNLVTVQNTGDCPLDFTVGAGCAWVSVVPNSGSLNPTQSMQLTVTEDCNNLWSGNYVCELRFTSNDPAQPLKIVNIYKHVGPDADIAVTPDSFSVEMFAGTSKDTSMNIANVGAGHLQFSISTQDFVPPKVGTPILTEGFEGAFPPAGWTRIQTSTDNQYPIPCWWSQTSYEIHTGAYSAGLWWSWLHQDEWLITPEVTLAGACTLSFWTFGYHGSPNGDHYYVKVSTDGGINWNVVFDMSAFPDTGFNTWAYPYKIGLNAYSGQTVKIAWHADDPPTNDGLWFIWLIDDVSLMSYAANWLVVDPTSGVVNPSGNKNINVTFNTEGVTSNDKYANIFIASNDPDEGMVAVRAHMKIVGPNYSVTPAETLVINALEGQYTDAFLTFGNSGGRGPLICKVSDAFKKDKGGWLAELPDSFQVPIDQTFDDTIRVDGHQLIAGDYSTKIYIQTNDYDVPRDTIVVIVHMGPAPGIAIDPHSFTVTVSAGTSKDTIMNITNTGGGHLAFEMSTEETKAKSDTILYEGFEGTTFPPAGWTSYDFDGADPWIRSTSYYHTGVASAYCSWDLPNNDWLITSQLSPKFGVPDTLKYWVRTASSGTYPEDYMVRLSTTTTDTSAFTTILLVETQVIYYPNFVEKVIPLDGYDGENIYIAFHLFSYDELGLYIDDVSLESFAPNWFTVVPMADTVAPSASVACTVTFDATQLLGGVKDGNILISSNAPGKRVDTVGVHMSVAGANYSVHPLELHVDMLENDVPTEHLYIMNSGLGPLFYRMTWPATWLTANPDTEMVLPSGEQDVIVRIDGTKLIAGEYYTEILVKTNAANQLLDTIPVFVHVGPNPDIVVSPMSLRVPVIPGCDKTVAVKVSNDGLGHLSFETSAGKESGPKLSGGFNPNQIDGVQMRMAKEVSKTKEARPLDKISPSHLWAGEVAESKSENPPAAAGAGTHLGFDRGDSLYYQRPYDPSESWSFYTTSSSAGYTCYDNFWVDPNARICDIHWWGLTAYNDGVSWYSCSPAGMQVEIKFYSDNPNDTLWANMPPTDVVCTYSNVVPTYVFYNTFSGFSAYYFSVELAPCCALTSGWVSIQSTYTPTTCWLLWSGSPQPGMGDGMSWQQGSSSSSTGEDLAIYLTGETAPPCPFSVSPVADTLDPSSFEDVILTFNGAAFDTCSEETLSCNLVFTTNDPVDPTVTVPVSAWAARGDVFYPECAIQLGDVVYLINYVYKHGPGFSPICRGDCAPSHDGIVDNEDVVYLIQFLYQGGPPPLATPTIDQPDNMERK